MEKRALVIDDDPEPAKIVCRILSRMGWETETVSSLDAALNAFRPGRFSLALCDVGLGAADGIALARQLLSQDPALRVTIMSGDPSNIERARASGFAECL